MGPGWCSLLLTNAGDYKPPTCIDNANTVIMNFTVTSKGVQFDRLALMYVFVLAHSHVVLSRSSNLTRTGTWVIQKFSEPRRLSQNAVEFDGFTKKICLSMTSTLFA